MGSLGRWWALGFRCTASPARDDAAALDMSSGRRPLSEGYGAHSNIEGVRAEKPTTK